jgi:hypothetical protein
MDVETTRSETRSGLPSPELWRPKASGRSSAWKRWGALVGIAGGPVSGVAGIGLLLASYWISANIAPLAAMAGNLLLFLVIPLLMLGAHCLDLLEDDRAANEAREKAELSLVMGTSAQTARPVSRPPVFLRLGNSHDKERTRGYTR